MSRQKYHAKAAVGSSGRRYPSQLERDRADELRLLERGGVIADLLEQPWVSLHAGIRCRPDFSYIEKKSGALIYEDTKGQETAVFRLHMKLWVAHGPAPLRVMKRQGKKGRIYLDREIVPTESPSCNDERG